MKKGQELPPGLEMVEVDDHLMGPTELNKRFGSEDATELQVEFIEFAEYLDEVLPDGREKSLALTRLEEASMWANKALSRDNG